MYLIIEIQLHSFSTSNICNLQRLYIRILDDGKVRHRILTRTYLEYSSHLRRKFGEGKCILLYPNQENLYLYFYLAFLYTTISGKKLVTAKPALMVLGAVVSLLGGHVYAWNNGEDTEMARMSICIRCLWFLRNGGSCMKMDQEFCKNCITVNNAHEAFFCWNIQLVYWSKQGFQMIKIPCKYSADGVKM